MLEADLRRRDVVGDDHVGALRASFAARWPALGGLRREAHDHLALGLVLSEVGQDVGGLLEHDGVEAARLLLDLARRGPRRPVVGHGRGHHDHVGPVGRARHRLVHLRRGLHRAAVDARGDRPIDGGHQRDRGAAGRGLFGQGVALLARGAVGDEADGVDRLAGAAGGDDHAAGPASDGGVSRRRTASSTIRRIGQAALAQITAGQPSLAGATTRRPSRRAWPGCRCTAGCSHISVCIAGQTMTGARVASSVAVSRSLEMPAA